MRRDDTVLRVQDLQVRFTTRQGHVTAVDGVDLELGRGEILGLVGESGCGKTVTAQAVMGLIGGGPAEDVSGRVLLHGEDLLARSESEMERLRGSRLAMIFQDPMTSLNPAHTVGDQVAEVPLVHQGLARRAARARAVEMLGTVGIPAPEDRARQYPHEFSGGMRQRALIAMALSCKPDLLMADEPTTALDVTVQAQILDLLLELRRDFATAIILITHDLGVVAQTCDRVAVMYAGSIVEQAPVRELFRRPRHPYTQGLLASLPVIGDRDRLKPIEGAPPDPTDLPPGCRFRPRCPYAFDECWRRPGLERVDRGHEVACWLEQGSHG